MKVKIKLKKKTASKLDREKEYPVGGTPRPLETARVPRGDFEKMMLEVREAPPRDELGIIRKWYEAKFDEFPPLDKRPYELVKLKLMYELLHQDYVNAGIPVPEKVQQNWEASRDFKIEDLTEGIRNMTEVCIRSKTRSDLFEGANKNGGSEMTKKIKKEKIKAVPAKEKVFESFIRIFSENFKLKLTDDQLAKKMKKAQPAREYDAKYMNMVRGVFNRGKLTSQTSAPRTPLPEFDAKGNATLHVRGDKKAAPAKKGKAEKEAGHAEEKIVEKPVKEAKKTIKLKKV